MATFSERVAAARYALVGLLVLITIVLLAPIGLTFVTTQIDRYDLSKYTAQEVPYHRVALVFGAGVLPNGQPTPYLVNRVKTAADLYKAGRVKKILMSGDNSTRNHNEPLVMKNYAISLGVPAQDITIDAAGFNTYDTCYRAKHIFQLNDATLITQGYHLPRAMTTCAWLGVSTNGVPAYHASRDYTTSYIAREMLSNDKMVVQQILKPKPTVLGKTDPIQ